MLSNINNLINVRDFLYRANENSMVKMTPEVSSKVSRKIAAIDKTLISLIVDIDLESIASKLVTKQINMQSTEEIQTISQMDEIVKAGLGDVKDQLKDLSKAVNK